MKTTKQLTKHSIAHVTYSSTAPLLFLLLPFVSACASDPSNSATDTNYGEITLEAGQSGTCVSSPCKFYLVMPPGKGSYEVLANGMTAGNYPAGQTASLGGYWAGLTNFTIVGSDVGPTRLNVVGRD